MEITPASLRICVACFRDNRATCDNGRPCNWCIEHGVDSECQDISEKTLEYPSHRARAEKILRRHKRQMRNKEKAPVKWEADRNLIKPCYKVIKELLSRRYANCNVKFKGPDDPWALGLPLQHKWKVEVPTYLSDLKENLNRGKYDGPEALKQDFKKVIATAQGYYPGRSDVYEAANKLGAAFDKLWKRFVLSADESAQEKADAGEEQEQSGEEQPGEEQPGEEQPGEEQPGEEQPGEELSEEKQPEEEQPDEEAESEVSEEE